MSTPNLPHDRTVSLNDRFQFHCTGCAACCRHIKEGVPLDSMDAYRLTKYLRSQGVGPTCTDDVLLRFGEPVPITDSGYFSYFLKTVGDNDSCIFLNGNRCNQRLTGCLSNINIFFPFRLHLDSHPQSVRPHHNP